MARTYMRPEALNPFDGPRLPDCRNPLEERLFQEVRGTANGTRVSRRSACVQSLDVKSHGDENDSDTVALVRCLRSVLKTAGDVVRWAYLNAPTAPSPVESSAS